jgi:hypothetical protein
MGAHQWGRAGRQYSYGYTTAGQGSWLQMGEMITIVGRKIRHVGLDVCVCAVGALGEAKMSLSHTRCRKVGVQCHGKGGKCMGG